MTNDTRRQADEARRIHQGRLADLGFTLTASDTSYECGRDDGPRASWSAHYFPNVEGTVAAYLSGVEAGLCIARLGLPVTTSRDRYDDEMQRAEEVWCDVIHALHAAGFMDASVTQTGGMCLAIEVTIGASTVLLTDYDDSLPWAVADQVGWTVCAYDRDAYANGEECEPCEVLYTHDTPALEPVIDALIAFEKATPTA